MAKILPDGSVVFLSGKVLLQDAPLSGGEILELVMLTPKIFPAIGMAGFPGRGGGFGGGGRGPAGPPGPNIDRYAATRIVSSDPNQGTDLTIQSAIDNLPAEGGSIAVLSGTYLLTSTVLLPAKPVTIFGTGNATVIDLASNAIAAFTTPTGLLALMYYKITGLGFSGDSTAEQNLVEVKDTTGRTYLYVDDCVTTGIKTPIKVTNYDTTYNRVTQIYLHRCHFKPLTATNSALVTAPNPSGTFGGALIVTFTDCMAFNDEVANKGWKFDIDADVCITNTTITIGDDLKCGGLYMDGGGDLFGGVNTPPHTVEAKGTTWQELIAIGRVLFTNIIMKFSAYGTAIGCQVGAGSQIVLNASRSRVADCLFDNFGTGAAPAYEVDILAGANDCSVSGSVFGKAATGFIRSSALRTRVVGCRFAAGGAVKTIVDAGAGDYTFGTGNIGVNTGGGMTLAGNSRASVGEAAGIGPCNMA
jgi:hypothetical protein